MRESGFHAQNKFSTKKSEEYWRNRQSQFELHQRGATRTFPEGIQGTGQFDTDSFVNAVYLHNLKERSNNIEPRELV